MEWVCLFFTTLAWIFGCWLSFSEESKQNWWYVPLGVCCGILTNFLWFFAIKNVNDKAYAYFLTVFWEATLVIVYFGIPLIFFGVKPDRFALFGLILIIAGMVFIKL